MAGKGSRVCSATGGPGPGPGPNRLQDSWESDSEPEVVAAPARIGVAGPPCRPPARACSQVIHSGHFMVSSPHSDPDPRWWRSGAPLMYDFDTVSRSGCQTYRYGPRSSGSLSIDPTLTRLFECMSLAYSGKIVSPKWKNFKGLRLQWRDKIRLNNAIWRAWFIQYAQRRKSSVCGFVTPLEGSEADAHRKPEAIVLEGSYWKRRIEVVIREYHKWRIYYKKRLQKKKDDILSMLQEGPICQANLEKWSNQMYQEPEAAPAEAHMFDLDCLLSDISDTLFTMTQKQSHWASDRHNTYTNNADMIQPGLTPLQPNLDDFMDIPDVFMNDRGQSHEQTGFADCSYFQSSSTSAFPPVPASVPPQLLLVSGLDQPGASPQPSSSNAPRNQSGSDCGEYHASGLGPGAMSYGHHLYPNTPVTIAFSTSMEQPATANIPFLHPLPCHKIGYYAPTSATSSVITHTASTVGAHGSGQQGFPLDTYLQTPCDPLGYGAALSDPVQAAQQPGVAAAHCFSVPEQVVATGVRGKRKKKTGGPKTGRPAINPAPAHLPNLAPTSCLAKLLSSGTRERKSSLGLDTTQVAAKAQRSSSSCAMQSSSSLHVGGASSQLQHGAAWPAGMSAMTPTMPGHSAPLSRAHASTTSRGMAVPALPTHGSTHTSTTLLLPKTEKLSPVLLYGSDGSGVYEHPERTPPLNTFDKGSNPESPQPGFSGHGKIESSKQTESRRITHTSAEQKRRFNIKLGFDTLHNLVTTLSSQPSIKISKATTLQKTTEYITKMQQERAQLHEEAKKLREEVQVLNSAINAFQLQLPATGVPITQQRFDHMRQKFREYIRVQTLQNWKFWIHQFSVLIEPLFESYNGMVSTTSMDDLCRSTLSWLDQHCSLPSLRPMVLSSLRLLSTTTAILTDPSLLPEQATLAVTQGDVAASRGDTDASLQPTTWNNLPSM